MAFFSTPRTLAPLSFSKNSSEPPPTPGRGAPMCFLASWVLWDTHLLLLLLLTASAARCCAPSPHRRHHCGVDTHTHTHTHTRTHAHAAAHHDGNQCCLTSRVLTLGQGPSLLLSKLPESMLLISCIGLFAFPPFIG